MCNKSINTNIDVQNKIDIKFNEHINVIVEVITDFCSENVESIFLYGGYGRDEGGWVIQKQTEGKIEVNPYNDYDIALIVSSKLDISEIKKIEEILKGKIAIKFIDISQYTTSELSKMKPFIKNYDLKYASKYIYGKPDLLDEIPSIDSKTLPLKDIETLFFTRIWTLIGSFDEKGLTRMQPNDEMFFRNQMAKAVLAIVDCILLQFRSYDSSYIKRVEILTDYTDDQNLIRMAAWALEEKLYPKSVKMNTLEVYNLYAEINKMFFEYFFIGLSKYYKKPINSVADVKNHFLFSLKNLIKRIISNVLMNNPQRNDMILLSILQIYTAWVYNREYCISEKKYLKRTLHKKFNFSNSDMDLIRIFVANKRLGL